jgi:SAM-dependent methyltransferase
MPTSYSPEIIEGDVEDRLSQGWRDATVAERQHDAFVPLLQAMKAGTPRADFIALGAAVQQTGLENPMIIEVGCGTGWNSEVLSHLFKRPFRYIGLDYSMAMLTSAKRHYRDAGFAVGDASALPIADSACDILLCGGVLMHVLGYADAIAESRRVTRRWCIFHTVPTVKRRPTVVLRKFAYGSPVVEVVLNFDEFAYLVERNGLVLRQAFDNIPHDYLSSLLDEPVSVQTYLCEVK